MIEKYEKAMDLNLVDEVKRIYQLLNDKKPKNINWAAFTVVYYEFLLENNPGCELITKKLNIWRKKLCKQLKK